MQKEIIKAKPSADGRIIINLYGSDFEIHKSMFKDGVAELRQFGKIYEIHKVSSEKKVRKKKSPKTIGEVLAESEPAQSN